MRIQDGSSTPLDKLQLQRMVRAAALFTEHTHDVADFASSRSFQAGVLARQSWSISSAFLLVVGPSPFCDADRASDRQEAHEMVQHRLASCSIILCMLGAGDAQGC
jgi:hypothetical protein